MTRYPGPGSSHHKHVIRWDFKYQLVRRLLIPHIVSLVLICSLCAPAPVFALPRSSQAVGDAGDAADIATRFIQDIAAADAFIWRTFSSLDVENYAAGVQAYFWLLRQAGKTHTDAEAALLSKHFRALAIVMPTALRQEVGLGESIADDPLERLVPGHASSIERWWRRSDNLPATHANERLEEHLRRVIFAHDNFTNRRDPRGFDDRGEIYIRLGDPSRKTEVRLLAPNLLVNMHSFVLPENEFWVYEHIDDEAQYLFIQKNKSRGFRLGTTTQLIPNRLKNSRRYTMDLLQWMEEVYGQLTLYHTAYGKRYDDLNNYLTLPATEARPDIFARSQLAQANTLDDQIAYQRTQHVPGVFSNTLGIADNLDVAVRWARFLNSDGTTRTEIFWKLNRAALKPSRRLLRNFYRQGHEPSEHYLISTATTLLNEHYEIESISQRHYRMQVKGTRDLPVRSVVVANDPAGSHIALQWDQQWVISGAAAETRPGARIKTGTYRIDSLQALHAEGQVLEMSDLKPLRTQPDLLLETAVPYPGRSLTPDMPLALYFEIYNLTYGANDQVHYEITYEVVRQQGRQLFSGRGNRSSAGASTTYTGSSRTVQEFIVPDLLSDNEVGPLEIIVHVKDLTSGATISRTVGFE